MSLQLDVQQLDVGVVVELFVLDTTALGGVVYRFHAGTNYLNGDVVWNGQTYSRMPIEATGFEYTGKGKLPRPTLKVQNVDGLIGAIADAYDDLIGATVTRKRTLVKYLDAVNFVGGTNPTADPSAAFVDDVYQVMRKSSHTKMSIEFELASSLDIHGTKIPGRLIIASVCTFGYREAECGYTGGAVAKIDDTPTSDLALDQCGKRVASCKLRFGANAPLPYGGFVGAGALAQ